MIEVGISKHFDTNAREQVNMIPQEMVMILPIELSNVWMVADDTISHIEYLIETEKEEPERGTPAEIKLRDGSIIKGEIQQEKIKIKTEYGEINIPVEDFISIIGELIKLKDGTTLRGSFAEKVLTVETNYGRLKAQTKDVDSVIFVKEPESPPEPEGIMPVTLTWKVVQLMGAGQPKPKIYHMTYIPCPRYRVALLKSPVREICMQGSARDVKPKGDYDVYSTKI